MAGAESSDTPWLSLFQVAYDPYSGYISLGAFFKKNKLTKETNKVDRNAPIASKDVFPKRSAKMINPKFL